MKRVPEVRLDRVYARRRALEERRLRDSAEYVPPIEPSPRQAATLYRQLLKTGNSTLVATDKDFFRRKVRDEFEITARRTSARVRGIMYEKGQWMVANSLGGLL